jgi:hypothetical protein
MNSQYLNCNLAAMDLPPVTVAVMIFLLIMSDNFFIQTIERDGEKLERLCQAVG